MDTLFQIPVEVNSELGINDLMKKEEYKRHLYY